MWCLYFEDRETGVSGEGFGIVILYSSYILLIFILYRTYIKPLEKVGMTGLCGKQFYRIGKRSIFVVLSKQFISFREILKNRNGGVILIL